MRSSHSDDEGISIDSYDVPGAGESLHFGVLVPFSVPALLSSPDDSEHFPFIQVDLPDCVVIRISNVNKMLVLPVNMAESLRVVKRALVVLSVHQADVAVSNSVHALAGV